MKQSFPPRSDNSNQPTGTAGKAGIDNRADDVWLTTPEATAWLAEVAQSTEPVHRLTSRLRKQLSASQTHRVIELVDLRRRGANKFTAAESMFFTRQALEQATDQSIARYKAERFAGCKLVADLCCGLGGDTAALAQVSRRVLACDRSEQVLDFAQRNLQAMLGDQVAEEGTQQVEWVASDVESLHLAEKGIDAWHIDPDRRPSGRRTVQVANHEPSEEAIEKLLSMVPHAAIKLSPACEPPAAWEAAGELEWISRGGECKQLVVWQGNLAREPGFRRATLLAAGDLEAEPRVVRTLVGDPETLPQYGDQVEQYLYEPDPALLAADLIGCLSQQHGLKTFASTTGYLTSSSLIVEPGCSRFEVLEVMPLKTKRVASYLRERNIGRLEIKHRAIELSPDKLRRELKLRGDESGVLLATRVGEKRIAILARRVAT